MSPASRAMPELITHTIRVARGLDNLSVFCADQRLLGTKCAGSYAYTGSPRDHIRPRACRALRPFLISRTLRSAGALPARFDERRHFEPLVNRPAGKGRCVFMLDCRECPGRQQANFRFLRKEKLRRHVEPHFFSLTELTMRYRTWRTDGMRWPAEP